MTNNRIITRVAGLAGNCGAAKKGLAFLLSFSAMIPANVLMAQRSASIRVVPTTKYQHIDGFGGTGMNGQWADNYTEAKVKALWGTGEESVGLNIMRIRINPNEGNWGEYGNAIKWARKYNPNVTVFATPWTPPKKWKTSKSTKYKNEFGTEVWPLVEHTWGGEGSNGGTFNDAYTEQYADFFERYRQTMEKKGCPIDMISIQNESDYTPTATDNGVEHASYESCIFSPNQMAKILKATRAHVDPKCKIMGPECFGWGQHTYNNKLVTLPDATNSIDIWGNHIYGINDWSYINTITKKTGKHMWMTEFLLDNKKSLQGNSAGTWENEFGMIENIEQVMNNGFSAYVYYNMLADFFGTGLSDNGETSSQLFKRAYVFGHYARYATGKNRIGMTLSDSNTSDKLAGSAYASENGDTITLFVLNKSAYKYTVILQLPSAMGCVRQIVTNESVNRKVIDKTDDYAGNTRPRLTLLPKTFYTFEFIKEPNTETEPAKSYKIASNNNPLSVSEFCADPTAIEHDGRLYVYATNDQQQFDYSDGLEVNDGSRITQFAVLSTSDFSNWTHHGVIDVKAAAPWITACSNPSVVSRHNTATGKDEFFLYFTNSKGGIGVLTSDSPTGPWTDPLGKALVDSKTPGIGKVSKVIDPGVAIDGNGTGWLVFGGGAPNADGSVSQPGNVRIVRLGGDMMSLASDFAEISAQYHLEANKLNVIGDKLVFSYCQNTSASDARSMRYMVIDTCDVLTGKWSQKALFLKNPSAGGYPSGNNHACIQHFGSSWYVLYHTQWLENKLGFSAGYRNLAANKLNVSETSSVRILSVTPNDIGAGQIAENRPLASDVNLANTFSNAAGVTIIEDVSSPTGMQTAVRPKSGGWIMVRNAVFNEDNSDQLVVDADGLGTVEVFLDNINESNMIACGAITGNGPVTLDLESALTGQHNVYFRFSSADNVVFRSWQFINPTGIEERKTGKQDSSSRVYDLTGREIKNGTGKMQKGQLRGIYIIGGKKVFLKQNGK